MAGEALQFHRGGEKEIGLAIAEKFLNIEGNEDPELPPELGSHAWRK